MFAKSSHYELFQSIEAIGASFAIYEFVDQLNNFKLVSCNSMYESIIEKNVEDALQENLVQLFPRYIEKPVRACLLQCMKDQSANEVEIVIEHKENIRWYRFVFSPIIDEKSQCHRIINTCIEITDKKKLESDLAIISERYEAVVEAAYDGIVTIDEDQNINMINGAAKYIFDVSDEDIIGQPLVGLFPHTFRDKHESYVNTFKNSSVKSRPMQRRASVRGLRSDGTEFPIEVTISKIKVQNKTEMTAVIRDISERAKLMEELSKAAKEDVLTGVYNRRYFTEVLLNEIKRSKRFEHPITLAMIDLDHFKEINDQHGHNVGDQVLIEIAQLIGTSIREVDEFCRWGGEEFMVLLTQTSLKDCVGWAERLRKEIEAYTVNYEGKAIQVTCSIGVISENYEKIEINKLLKEVDHVLYKAKESGRNIVVSE